MVVAMPPWRNLPEPPRLRPKARVSMTDRKGSRQERAVAHLRQADPVLRRLIDAHPDFDPRAWLAELPPMDAFGALLFQIVGQQLSIQATRAILGRLGDRFGGALPTPVALLAASPGDLARAGLSRRKVATVQEVARRFADGRWSEPDLRTRSDHEIQELLTTVSGIGPWTVHGFLIIALDRPDVVLPGDLALRKAIGKLYGLDHLPSPAQVTRLAEPWRPWRSLATAYLMAAAFAGVDGGPGGLSGGGRRCGPGRRWTARGPQRGPPR